MKYLLLALTTTFILAGCSAKEFNDNVDSITNDVSKVFEDGKDK